MIDTRPAQRFLIGLSLLLLPFGLFAASAPDEYESSPYDDNSSATTQNMLVQGATQDHTFHTASDVDWGRAVTPIDGVAFFHLEFSNLNVPGGSDLYVQVWCDGPGAPPKYAEYLIAGDVTNFAWQPISNDCYFSVTAYGSVEPTASYSVTLRRDGGANNGMAISINSRSIKVQWDTIGGFSGTEEAFRVSRSTLSNPGNYTMLSDSVPVPGVSGSCPSGGCVEYTDETVNPMLVYFYKVEVRRTGNVYESWTPLFTGYTTPVTVSLVEIE